MSHIYNFLMYLTLSIFKSSLENISVGFFLEGSKGAIKFKIQNVRNKVIVEILEKKLI